MKHTRFAVLFASSLVGALGCAKDRSLAPVSGDGYVDVVLKLSGELVAEDLEFIYRSTVCTFTNHTASGKPYLRDGYQRMDMQALRQGSTDLFKARLPVNGGGACRWRLSNVTFGVKYEDGKKFGDDVLFGAGGGIVVMFDEHSASSGGLSIDVDGDLVIKQDYYPWVNERFVGGYKKTVSLAGSGPIYAKYRALQARKVYFEPVVHTDFVVHSIQPKAKSEGKRTIFHYPDGSRSMESLTRPNFQKLQAIRLQTGS